MNFVLSVRVPQWRGCHYWNTDTLPTQPLDFNLYMPRPVPNPIPVAEKLFSIRYESETEGNVDFQSESIIFGLSQTSFGLNHPLSPLCRYRHPPASKIHFGHLGSGTVWQEVCTCAREPVVSDAGRYSNNSSRRGNHRHYAINRIGLISVLFSVLFRSESSALGSNQLHPQVTPETRSWPPGRHTPTD